MCSSISDSFPEELSGLIDAVLKEDYSNINEDLRRFTGVFSSRAAFYLLSSALAENLPLKTFEAILERSPPVAELFSDYNPSAVMLRNAIALIERLARLNRADVLALLLERGASPNRAGNHDYGRTPLEETLRNGSLESLELLLRHPELDASWTDQLLLEWAMAEYAEPRRQQCLRALAPRFTGREAPPDRPLPIPEAMTAHIITLVRNWSLLERFCRERGRVSPEDGQRAFSQMTYSARYLEEERRARASALAALLESCPDLLAQEENSLTLLRRFLELGEEARKCLRPWVEGMVIDRWSCAFDSVPVRYFSTVLDICQIGGTGRRGELSPAARTLLQLADVPLITSLCQKPDGLLATEDPGALTDLVLTEGFPRIKQAAVLACVRRVESYDL